jgi:hypothetical protein
MWFDRDADRPNRVANQYSIQSNSIHSGQQSDEGFIPPIQLTIDYYGTYMGMNLLMM